LLKKYIKPVFITVIWIYSGCLSFSQNNPVTSGNAVMQQDTVSVDTTSTASQSGTRNVIEVPIKYNSEDSLRFEVKAHKVYLYGQAVVNYENIVLEADYIVLDTKNNIIIATGWPDSTLNIISRHKKVLLRELLLKNRVDTCIVHEQRNTLMVKYM